MVLAAIAVCVLVLTVAETHIAFVTLALCSGFVLSEYAGPEAFDALSSLIDVNSFPLYETVNVTLLLLPALLVGIRFRRTQRGVKRFVEQLIPGLAVSLMLAVFLIDIAPINVASDLQEESYIASTLKASSMWLIIFAMGSALFDVLNKHGGDTGKKRGPGRPPKK